MKLPRNKKIPKEKIIADLIKKLNCTEEEAEDIFQTDQAIDNDERVYFDLSDREAREANRWQAVTTKSPVKKPNDMRGKAHPPNELKEKIIWILNELMTNYSDFLFENVEIINKNRQIAFKSGDKSFELTLVQKRNAK